MTQRIQTRFNAETGLAFRVVTAHMSAIERQDSEAPPAGFGPWRVEWGDGTYHYVSVEQESLRAKALYAVRGEVGEAAANAHQGNYHRLHVRRDGTVHWSEYNDQNSTLVDDSRDDDGGNISTVPDVIRTGTGSVPCNCDHCEDVGYETVEDAIADAVADADTSGIEEGMVEQFARVCPVGYFEDEEGQA
jgi:hypothetical protein